MDVAYDHITEEALAPKEGDPEPSSPRHTTLDQEVRGAFQAVSATPWGATLGGWFGHVKKQSESFYQDLQKEALDASEQASKGFSTLREQVVTRTAALSVSLPPLRARPDTTTRAEGTATSETEREGEAGQEGSPRTEAVSRENIVKEATALVASLRSTAAQRLRDLRQAEDAADEALERFGMNVRDFLRNAVTISGPSEGVQAGDENVTHEVMFETQEPGTGKKVFHSTRFDAQLHAIHTTAASFLHDGQGSEWDQWIASFDTEKQTEEITQDLEKYEELRRAFEKLVPEKVTYQIFWLRYYFLRKAIEEEERRRKEVLQGAAKDSEEPIAWDDDDEDDGEEDDEEGDEEDDEEEEEDEDEEDDDEEEDDDDEDDDDEEEDDDDEDEDDEDEEDDKSATPQVKPSKTNASTTTLNAPVSKGLAALKSAQKSEDGPKSVAGSDASYDMLSSTASRSGLDTPTDEKRKELGKEDSDDDWE